MKKIFLLVFGFILIVQGVTYAEINKNMHNTRVYYIESFYKDVLEVNKDSYSVKLNLQKYNEGEGLGLVIFVSPENKERKDEYIPFVFTIKNPPYMQIVNQGTKKNLPLFKKVTGVNKAFTNGPIDRKSQADALVGDVVYIVLITKDGKEERVEIPKEIINEWQYVITADMRKVKKEIMGN